MRTLKILLLGISILMLAMPVWAGCPQDGPYTSQGGEMLLGRASESWAGGGEGQIGNTVLAQSWDGVELGTQWYMACPAICADPVLLDDMVNPEGNGYMTYMTSYCGGILWLNGDGTAWTNGDAEYIIDLAETIFYTTILFVGGTPVGHVTNIEMAGEFEGCPETCLAFDVANATQMGSGLGSEFPLDYPPTVVAPDCTEDLGLMGSWWDVIDIMMTISGCSTATEDVSWSQVKSLYR